MLTTIKGIYEDGIIKPLEKVDVKGKAEVIITFLNSAKKRKTAFLSTAGSWEDIDTDTLKKKIYENRRISTREKIKL
jgi:predicted DNA-binding antitoxin AbrB/MazE fold protein